ncbi:MAG: DUF2946 family protein [Hyphomicrobiales bacterium]|nr:DUF2946 family protein [Hyphomicrobiales bacterium]MCP5374047.1 DUF2946 family protein [Hyphomicrobiales bacterium]
MARRRSAINPTTRPPRRYRLRRAWSVWLGVTALLLHAVIPIGQGISVSAGDRHGPGGRDFLVICAAYGLTPLDQGRKAPADRRADSHACVICQIQSLGKATTTVVATALPVPQVFAAHHGSPVLERDTIGRTPRTALARAPPAFA